MSKTVKIVSVPGWARSKTARHIHTVLTSVPEEQDAAGLASKVLSTAAGSFPPAQDDGHGILG